MSAICIMIQYPTPTIAVAPAKTHGPRSVSNMGRMNPGFRRFTIPNTTNGRAPRIRADNFDEAIEQANAIGFGLSAGIITNNLQRAFQFANRIEAGVVKINEPTTGLALQAPFGGFKQSSANTFKEQGQAAIEFYTRTKTIYMGHG